jgi:hypothetical protein
MSFPRWYKIMTLIWLFAAPAFWWFATSFNDLPFFALPTLASPDEGAGWQISLVIQFAIYGALLAPITTLPLVLLRRGRLKTPDENL